ncbi:hypothetical protein [Agathobacter sp.]
MRSMGKYDDIINLPHHVSSVHPQMSIWDRSAQFSPFAALTGHEAAIEETARLTEQWHEPDEDKREELDEKLRQIMLTYKKIDTGKNIEVYSDINNCGIGLNILYFKPDKLKEGGSYEHVTGKLRKMDDINHKLEITDDAGKRIVIDTAMIYNIESTD